MADLIPFNSRRGPRLHGGGPDPLDLQSGGDHARSATEFVGIREYFAIVRRHIWLVLGVLVLSVSYTVNSARKERPTYRASSTVRLVDARRSITGDMSGGSASEVPFSYQIDPIESQIQVLRSEAVAAVAVDMKGLRLIPSDKQQFVDEITNINVADNPATQSVTLAFDATGFNLQSNGRAVSASYRQPAELDGVRIVVSKRPSIPSTTFDVVSREAAIGHALGGFQPAQRGKTDILDLSYTGSEPYETKRIANAMAEAFQAQNASTAQQLSRRRRTFLEDQLRQSDALLAQASGAYSAFRSGRQIFNSATRAGAQEQSLIGIDTRREELNAEKTTYETLLAQARQNRQSATSSLRALVSLPGLAANPVVQQLYQQLAEYERTRDALINSGAARTNPDVGAIGSLIPSATEKVMDAVQSQIQSINAQMSALDRLRASGASRIAAAPAAETQELELSQQVQTIRTTVDQLQSELQRAKMSEAVEAGQVQIVQLATSPGYRMPTGQTRKLVVGLLVGMMFGFGAAVVVDALDASIRRRSDIEKILGIPSLGVIPRLSVTHAARTGVARALPRLKRSSQTAVVRPDNDLVTVTDVRSAGAEAIRTLRTNLKFSQSVRAMRTLVITSASPSEGKTTTASNLAASFAQQGRRVLLVDCDLRRARLHRMFGIPREPGLTDLVLGYRDEASVTRPTSVPGLYVISSGKLPSNPAELLGSDGMRRIMTALTEGYDLVVVDTPPILVASDAAILATLVDGVILVLRAGTTESAAAQQAIQQLNSVGARVVGAVLNDPDSQVPKYGAYYKYQYAAADA